MSFHDSPFMSVVAAEACAIKPIDDAVEEEHCLAMMVSVSIVCNVSTGGGIDVAIACA